MHFVVCFSQRLDEVCLKKPGSFAFDLDSHMRRQYQRFLDRVLGRPLHFKPADLLGLVSEYLRSQGYSTTNLKLLQDEDAAFDASYLAKKQIHGCLKTLNVTLAVKLLRTHKRLIRSPKQVWLLLHMLSLVKLLRAGTDSRSLAQWMNRHLAGYKGHKVEVLTLSGKVAQIEMKVQLAHQTYTFELLVRGPSDRSFDLVSNKLKNLLVDRLMLQLGPKRSLEQYQGTALEKLLIHFKLLQKELEKEGVLPFNKFL